MRGRQGHCGRAREELRPAFSRSWFAAGVRYRIVNNGLGNEGAEAIADSMLRNRVLTTLALSLGFPMLKIVGNNGIKAAGARRLAAALSKNCVLSALYLGTGRDSRLEYRKQPHRRPRGGGDRGVFVPESCADRPRSLFFCAE